MIDTVVLEPGGAHHTGADHRTHEKALAINLDPLPYGTFAEIGGGQEVARWFFRVGGAAGTVAKTMSAYDMQYSDAIYGKAGRYVSRERLAAMLNHEYQLLLERLQGTRGSRTTFFVFADTVSARNYHGTNECHGWLGIRFQTEPGGEPNDIFIHVNLLDNSNLLQQQALGVLGVNLLHAAFYHRRSRERMLEALMESLSLARIEIDYLHLAGKAFLTADEGTLGLALVRAKLCRAIAFDSEGALTHPSALLHRRPVIMQRGSFNRITPHFAEMLGTAQQQLHRELPIEPQKPLSCFEITTRGARPGDDLRDEQILDRVRALCAFGIPTFVTDFTETFHITEYLRRYTREPIRLVIGVGTLVPLLRSGFYTGIEGGLLEALGKLLLQGVKMYVFPMPLENFAEKLQAYGVEKGFCRSIGDGDVTARTLQFQGGLHHLYSYLLAAGHFVPVDAEP